MDLPELKTDVVTAEADAGKVESWIKANWHYAVAIAVAGLILGAAFGYHIGCRHI